jgi:hypothetical protein
LTRLFNRFAAGTTFLLIAALTPGCAGNPSPAAPPAVTSPAPAPAPAPAAPVATPAPETAPAAALPDRLSDADFWKLITELSEPGGYFRSDNLLSNEVWLQYVIPDLLAVAKPGRVYMGVGPEQNFTYIAALKPAMVFITDVRRGNLDLHLMYKALFEMSADRADFVGRLFSRPRPEGLTAASSVREIFSAYANVPADQKLYDANYKAIVDHLQTTHRFPLDAEDPPYIEYVYHYFFQFGPDLTYWMSGGGIGGGRGGFRNSPTYADLMIATDEAGTLRGYLASEDNYNVLKTLHSKNLFVPVVGNFAGPKALRAVGAWLKRHHGMVSAFYLSNVEQYLNMDGIWMDFCKNASELPIDETSQFIRSYRGGGGPGFGGGASLTQGIYPMAVDLKLCAGLASK